MSAVDLSKVYIPSRKPTPVLKSTRQYAPQYLNWFILIIKRKVCETLNVMWEILFYFVLMDQWNSQYVSLYPQYPAFIKRVLIVNCYIVLVNYCDHLQNIYPILTHWMVHFEVTSTVPVCCLAVEFNVTLFSVEH
jgi:hypothetical protein